MGVQIGVIGAGVCGEADKSLAKKVGREIAKRGGILVCGGLGGVMEAASQGAKEAGGSTLGLLPGTDKGEANPWIDIAVVTGLGHARNVLLAQTSEALIALDGEYGTLSEIALGLKLGKPVVQLESRWKIEGVKEAKNPEMAVEMAFSLIKANPKTYIQKRKNE
ncbi:MAG: TIGR00725 family protein [Methanosarcinaceae archaeon]|nr:TIGR00725 family protein [Methanosarcinaceae archaeon]